MAVGGARVTEVREERSEWRPQRGIEVPALAKGCVMEPCTELGIQREQGCVYGFYRPLKKMRLRGGEGVGLFCLD